MSDIPRPKRHLIEASKHWPGAWQWVDQFRANRGNGALPDWPDWCFLPLSGAHAIVGGGRELNLDETRYVSVLGALAAWRVTQGIYRFDADVFRSLWETPIKGAIPVDVLYHLPEWCVYIETPGQQAFERPIHGFYAHLEWDPNENHSELRFVLDFADAGDSLEALLGIPLHLIQGGIAESLQATVDEAIRNVRNFGLDVGSYIPDVHSETEQHLQPSFEPLVSLVLYLCSQAAEYVGDQRPSRPQPTKTKRGPRIFPPDMPTVWQTGFRLGAALRRAENLRRTGEGSAERRSPRPHIRRAHWRTYWTGPRSAEQTPVLRWIHPVLVGADEDEEILPTIRLVKGLTVYEPDRD